MADRIIERKETETPRDTVVVNEDRGARKSNTGLIVAIILIVLVLLFLFGGSIFGGGGSAPTNNTNIQTPSPSQGQ